MEHEIAELASIVKDLAEIVARLTNENDVLARPEGRLEAERLAIQAARIAAHTSPTAR